MINKEYFKSPALSKYFGPTRNAFYFLIVLIFIAVSVHFASNSLNHKKLFNVISNKSLVALKSNDKFYVSCDYNDGGKIQANRKLLLEWEKFNIHVLGKDKVAFQGNHNDFIFSPETEDSILCIGGTEILERAIFTIKRIKDNLIVIKDYKGRTLYVDPQQRILATKDAHSSLMTFNLELLSEKVTDRFNNYQSILFYLAIFFLVLSYYVFFKMKKELGAVLLLSIGALFFRMLVCTLNTHLQLWDEQFHALVAKNMTDSLFNPMLIVHHLFPFKIADWTSNNIWLHKQPLFLWQMALSIKCLGNNLFAIRLPSLLMSTLLIYFVFRIAKLLVNSKVGYFSGLILATSYYIIELSNGTFNTDHNDIAFMFYVGVSIWGWFEYEYGIRKDKWKYLIVIGISSGLAVLVKWLVGIVVYSGWFISIVLVRERRIDSKNYKGLLFSFLLTLAVFLPWQFYIFSVFPHESAYEFEYNTRHLLEVIEDHGGGMFFHFNMAEQLYGVSFLLILSLMFLFLIRLKDDFSKWFIASILFIVYIFYSIAQTKMIGFTLCIGSLLYLIFGYAVYGIREIIFKNNFKDKKFIWLNSFSFILLLVWIVNVNLQWDRMKEFHLNWRKDYHCFYSIRDRNHYVLEHLGFIVGDEGKSVLLNCRQDDIAVALFYNDLFSAISFIPGLEQYNEMKKKHKLVVLDDGKLPEYVQESEQVKIINASYWK